MHNKNKIKIKEQLKILYIHKKKQIKKNTIFKRQTKTDKFKFSKFKYLINNEIEIQNHQNDR